MVTDLLGTLLQELGKSLEIAELSPDENNSCLIELKNGQQIQLELDRSGQFFVIGADIGMVPPGKYRENLFRQASYIACIYGAKKSGENSSSGSESHGQWTVWCRY